MSNLRHHRVKGKKNIRHNKQTQRERQARARNRGWLKIEHQQIKMPTDNETTEMWRE